MAGLGCRVLQGCKDGMHHAMPWQRMQERGCAMTQAGHRRRAGVKDVIVHQVMCACDPPQDPRRMGASGSRTGPSPCGSCSLVRPCRDTARTGESPHPHTQPPMEDLWDHPGAQGWHVGPPSPCSLSPSTCKAGTLQCRAEPGCRVDGGWSPWGPWSPCSPGCHAGTQLASRQCNNPTPQLGGRGCSGHSQRQRPCPATEGCPGGGCGAPGGHGGHRACGGHGVVGYTGAWDVWGMWGGWGVKGWPRGRWDAQGVRGA